MEQVNRKNFDFYNNIGVDTFQSMAVQGGFSTYADLEIVYQHIHPVNSILEIGAGYGRCINFLLQQQHKGSITAVEQSPVLIKHLVQHYAGRAEIIEGDINAIEIKSPVDVILWMWSGILDFSKEEQAAAVKRLAGITAPGGKIFIDVPRMGVQTIAEHTDQQHIKLTTAFGEVECYIPSNEEIQVYASSAGFTKVQQTNYETSTEKKRTMYILTKQQP
jgi:trans-aconitate methyltransferase